MIKSFCKFLSLTIIIFYLLVPNSDVFAANYVIETSKLTTKEASKKYSITEGKLMAVGDIMMHVPLIESGYNNQNNTYSYEDFFTEVKDVFSEGDWVIGNLETPLSGAKYGYYDGKFPPFFNAPESLANALKNVGFNVLQTANNHALDKGEQGVLNTLKNIRKRNIEPVGTAASSEEASQILMIEKNQISMAILAYTYGINSHKNKIYIPKRKEYLVSLIDKKQIIKDIQKARQQGADLVTVALHFGEQYKIYPDSRDRRLVKSLVKAGADIILGSHPHVVQPYQIFEVELENGETRKAVAIYSLGNFISSHKLSGKYKDLGVIFEVDFSKNLSDGTVGITKIMALPTWTHHYRKNNKWKFRVLPLEKVINQKNDPLLTKEDYPVLARYLDDVNEHLKTYPKSIIKNHSFIEKKQNYLFVNSIEE